jgi:hypothetical protein
MFPPSINYDIKLHDIATTVEHLASEGDRFIMGAVILTDGGSAAKRASDGLPRISVSGPA